MAVSWELADFRKFAAQARRDALIVLGPSNVEGYCTGGRPLSFGAKPWCDERAVTSIAQPAFTWYANKCHCAGYLSEGGETRELAAHARRVALVVIGLRIMKGHCTGGRPLSSGATPRHVVRELAPLRWLSLGRWRNTRACRARAPCRARCDRYTHYERAPYRRETSLLRRNTVVRRVSCDLQRAAGIHVAREQAPLR